MRSIYTSDYYGWTQQQAELLRAGKLGDLDVNNLLEELESIGGSERRELESRLEVLFMHLLKWTYQPNFRGKSWTLTIKEQRRKIARRLEKSPSLKRELSEMAVESYGDAILSAARETGLDEENFPPEMPWTLADALREDFMPE
ncbi:DUF29 domain-containing protein [Salmonella enterica subsp. houtenae]|uniref:DUF29 domain-containing protein n=2 Tax=Salmonella houtenae TaxID=59205 RepID=A0A5Y6M6A4_SALHO|nr:DUF29 domain-containing protein [Salmonella enterica subsp. enterica]EAO9679421.1 DUF29 domain-containing protein [Salmonella enterica]EBF8286063.1 DUF29 domain-containing protein [Salmonella enterica subsp. houtenae]EBQ5980780.1 DUF29 domain-containing protein [Salmonella enterica subsp. houtenae serovar Houten]ECM3642833.1 DUF29 domain-containing protein [Salmonella enterica subsp. enterica serovar Typhimurium]EDS4965753.1 DUF29 domain-containing protein [Salmonella enterica subsp. enteri